MLWVLPGYFDRLSRAEKPELELLNSTLASARMRIGVAATYWQLGGHQNVFVNADDESALKAIDCAKFDLCFVNKFTPFSSIDSWLGLMGRMSHLKRRVVLDICDYPFHKTNDSRVVEFYQQAILQCDVVAVNSDRMKFLLYSHTPKKIQVIDDAILEKPRPPRFDPGGELKLVWFGHPKNIIFLGKWMPALKKFSEKKRIELTIVSNPEIKKDVEKARAYIAPHGSVKFEPWSFASQRKALEDSDVVLIPGDPADPRKSGVSSNRLAEALQAGRFPLATPLVSYQPFAGAAWLGEDLVEGLHFALSNSEEVRARISRGQDIVRQKLLPKVIGKQWREFLGGLGAAAGTPPATGERNVPPRIDPLKKLNLGCGDKLLPGYLNVDAAESRSGRKPDLVCDLRRLKPFKNDEVDEILCVHVVEHFYRWEIIDVLREWARVLKPGGSMIIECPNLLTACQELLRDPEHAALPGKEGQRSMWVLFGDPSWKDPLMTHHWAYTPQSLGQIMREAGLVNIRQEPAQFKLREPRDMRLVGEKPGDP